MGITISIYSDECGTEYQTDVQRYLDELQAEVDRLYPNLDIQVRFVIGTSISHCVQGTEDEQLADYLHYLSNQIWDHGKWHNPREANEQIHT